MSPLGWFRTGPAQAVDGTASEEMVPRMRRAQWRIFLSLLFGYACFYTCRLSLSVAKKPMLAAEVVTLDPRRFKRYAIGGERLDEWELYPEIIESDLVINVPDSMDSGAVTGAQRNGPKLSSSGRSPTSGDSTAVGLQSAP